MLHPIFKSRNHILGYCIIWLIVSILHVFILLYFYQIQPIIALVESLVFNALLSLLGIGVWYPVYYTDLEQNKVSNFIINHLASGSLAIGIWVWMGYMLLSNIFADNEQYIRYLNISIPWRVAIGFLMYVLIASNYYLLIYYHSYKDKQLRELELKALVKESQLNSLKSQINPHFLFNSLNSISSLTMVSPERAQDMVINLSDFLRYSLSIKNESITTLNKELQNIDRYLKIEKIRFGKRLNIIRDIDSNCEKGLIPGLILQPIMENAIKYGVYESTEQSNISLKVSCVNDTLEVSITNDYDPTYLVRKGEGIGLRNVSSRMKIQYGRDDLIKITKTDAYFRVTFLFPQTLMS